MMIKIHKAFVSYDKEEVWLNEMAAKGLMLVHYSWCTYLFQEGTPGEYIYRLELLENLPDHPESQRYLDFMRDAGAEPVCFWMRWVYFRKKAADGPFEIYSDASGKLAHYLRVNRFMRVLFIMNVICALYNLSFAIFTSVPSVPANLIVGCVNAGASIALGGVLYRVHKKMHKVRHESMLHE